MSDFHRVQRFPPHINLTATEILLKVALSTLNITIKDGNCNLEKDTRY
jgi:hypothetical protein